MKEECPRRSCAYWHNPHGGGTPNSCDYLMIEGKSRIAQIPNRKERRDWSKCPCYKAGKKRKCLPVLPFEMRPKYDWALAMRLYRAGYSDSAIADMLGCSRSGVKWWRRKMGLTPNRNSGDET